MARTGSGRRSRRDLRRDGGAGSLEFAREVFMVLDVYEPDVLEAWYQLNATGDPQWFGALIAAVGE